MSLYLTKAKIMPLLYLVDMQMIQWTSFFQLIKMILMILGLQGAAMATTNNLFSIIYIFLILHNLTICFNAGSIFLNS